MGPARLRPGITALAVFACLALSSQLALAANSSQPAAEGAGWYFNTTNDEVKFGITANFSRNFAPQGRFDFFNTVTGANVQGTITSWEPMNDACGSFTPDPFFTTPPQGAPGAVLHGVCDKGANCTFDINVVDGGSPGSKGKDFVCKVHVVGTDKRGNSIIEDQQAFQPIARGNINIRQ
jgi:hypothetical protein